MNPVLILLAGVGIGGTVGVVAISMTAASKVEPPPLVKDKNMTVNRNKVEEASEDDEK